MDNTPSNTPVAVIFAGGEGTRLWPVSTALLPKQINPVFSDHTLLKEAYDRARLIFPPERIVVVTTQNLAASVRALLDLEEKCILVQPSNMDTALAMGITALHLHIHYQNPIGVMFFSDHRIPDTSAFATNILQAIEAAKAIEGLVCIGTKARSPLTQYGYIRLGSKLPDHKLYEVTEFTEKPDKDTAVQYVKSGEYVWNTGVYIWNNAILFENFKAVAPQMYAALLELRAVYGSDGYAEKLDEIFSHTAPLSFEHGVIEHLKRLYVFVASYDWNDIGNWKSFFQTQPADLHGNILLTHDAGTIDVREVRNTSILSSEHRMVVVGVQDLIIVQANGTTVITHKDSIDKLNAFLKEVKTEHP